MRNFSSLTPHDWVQIASAANGQVSGTLEEWPHLATAIRKTGVELPLSTTAHELKWCCDSLYWQSRADEYASTAGAQAEAAREHESRAESLAFDNERLRKENDHLKEALRLESNYAARPDLPPAILGGRYDRPE